MADPTRREVLAQLTQDSIDMGTYDMPADLFCESCAMGFSCPEHDPKSPADPTRYGVDGSTRGSELARAQQHLTPRERAAIGDLAEDVHSRVQETVVDDLLNRLEADRG